jgi:hypothetical protein
LFQLHKQTPCEEKSGKVETNVITLFHNYTSGSALVVILSSEREGEDKKAEIDKKTKNFMTCTKSHFRRLFTCDILRPVATISEQNNGGTVNALYPYVGQSIIDPQLGLCTILDIRSNGAVIVEDDRGHKWLLGSGSFHFDNNLFSYVPTTGE